VQCPVLCDAPAPAVPELTPIQGELQAQIMAVLWRLGSGTVEQVRSGLPPRYQGAYTTVQTVLNRLAERGLLTRTKDGNAMVYRPRISEADYVARSIERTLASASVDARQAALARLIGDLQPAELSDLQRLAGELEGRRGRRRR
jgi:predicted transcriptional regulator